MPNRANLLSIRKKCNYVFNIDTNYLVGIDVGVGVDAKIAGISYS